MLHIQIRINAVSQAGPAICREEVGLNLHRQKGLRLSYETH